MSDRGDGDTHSPIGETLAGRFRVVAWLENVRGGSVYLAEQVPLGRKVGVKLLDPVPADSPTARRFAREAAALIRLRHPNTIRVFDQGNWQGRPFLVTERVEGGRLDDAFAAGAMAPARLVPIARQIAAALAEAHARGLIHRDLRPLNVLLTENGPDVDFVKVVDFGLVKDMTADESDTTADGVLLGSPWYMSPEQIRGGAIDMRSDVYALGVMLYKGLSGRLPFPDQHTGQLLKAQVDQPPPPLPKDLDLPDVVRWTVLTCLAKEPDRRFGDMEEVGKALRACSVALVDPAWRDVAVTLDSGRAIVPDDLPDDGWLRALPVALRTEPGPPMRQEVPPGAPAAVWIVGGIGIFMLGIGIGVGVSMIGVLILMISR